METTNLINVKKSCQTTAKVLGIISTIITVLMVCVFVGAGTCFVMKSSIEQVLSSSPDITSNLVTSISILGFDLRFDMANGYYAVKIGASLLAFGLALVFLKIALISFRKIFFTILNSGSPFSSEVISSMKKAFILITVFITLSTGIGIGLILALFLWCIYNIFKYGHDLQTQADETI